MQCRWCDTIHLTRVHADVAGDTFFPTLDPSQWRETHGRDASRRRASCLRVHLRRRSNRIVPDECHGKPRLRYNCSKCPGYCCSHARIAVSDFDIARLARHFDLTTGQAKRASPITTRPRKSTSRSCGTSVITSTSRSAASSTPSERRCTIYEARPNVCRKYPYGNRCGYYDFLKFEREHQDDDEFIPSA